MADLLSLPEILKISKKTNYIKSGVYFLIYEKEIVYVGSSMNIYARLTAHNNNKNLEFDSYSIIEAPEKDLKELEADYIFWFTPEHNKNLYSENIKQIARIKPTYNQALSLECSIIGNKIYVRDGQDFEIIRPQDKWKKEK